MLHPASDTKVILSAGGHDKCYVSEFVDPTHMDIHR
jgi:hypothetical protein